MSHTHPPFYRPVSRREMLQICKCGFGSIALSSLFGSYLSSCSTSGNDKNAAGGAIGAMQAIPPHFLPKAQFKSYDILFKSASIYHYNKSF